MILTTLVNNDLLTRLVKTLDLRGINPGNLMVSLHRGFPGETGENEATGVYYSRQSCLFNAPGAGQITNANQLVFFRRTGASVITETLMYTDNFNRTNVGYCSGSIGGDWTVYAGCAGIESNRLKMGLNLAQPVRVMWDKNGVSALTGQFTRARLRSWRLRPQMGLVLMGSKTSNQSLAGYTAMIHPGPTPGIIDPIVRVYRPGPTSSAELLVQEGVTGHPMAEWTFTALPFVDHTFLQVKREGNTVIEYDDYAAARIGSGYQGLNVRHDLIGDSDSGWDVFWDDWEAGGASLDSAGGGGSPDVLITHVGFWTADQTLFLGSGRLNDSIHLTLNQLLTIEIEDLKLTVTTADGTATNAYKEKHLDRFGRGLNFTTAPLQMSLHTGDPGLVGDNEISGSRISVPVSSWEVATAQTTTNGTRIDFPNIPTNTITHLGVWSLDGEFLFGFELTSPISASLPLQTIRFLAGRLSFSVPTGTVGFLNAAGEATVAFVGSLVVPGAASMAGIGAAAFSSAEVKVGALSAAGIGAAAFTGIATFGGWNAWTNRNASTTGFNRFAAIADSPSRIYYSPGNASDGNTRFVSLLKSNLTTFTTHTMPASKPILASIAALDDDDTVFIGSSSTGNNAAIWKFKHSTGFTTLTWPGPGGSSDAFFVFRHPTNADIIFVGNGSGAANDVRLYTYSISGNTFTKIGGTGLNSSWNVSGSSKSVQGITFDATHIYVMETGGSTNVLNVWRAVLDDYSTWTRIGGAALNSSWATGTKRNGVLTISATTGNLYACIGGGSAGDAEVWKCTNPGSSPAWTQIGGDSINSSWATGNWTNCSRVTKRSNRIITGLLGTASGDSDIWQYEELAGVWTQIGGDGIRSSWSTKKEVDSVWVDREDRLWASVSDNSDATAGLWSEAVL